MFLPSANIDKERTLSRWRRSSSFSVRKLSFIRLKGRDRADRYRTSTSHVRIEVGQGRRSHRLGLSPPKRRGIPVWNPRKLRRTLVNFIPRLYGWPSPIDPSPLGSLSIGLPRWRKIIWNNRGLLSFWSIPREMYEWLSNYERVEFGSCLRTLSSFRFIRDA